MNKYDYIKCPYCDNAVELKDCPDFWCNEKHTDYKKQEKILKNMQKYGFNVVSCGICDGIILIEKETKLFEKVYEACLLKNLFGSVENLIQKAVDPEKTKNMYESLDCLYDALDICKKVREYEIK